MTDFYDTWRRKYEKLCVLVLSLKQKVYKMKKSLYTTSSLNFCQELTNYLRFKYSKGSNFFLFCLLAKHFVEITWIVHSKYTVVTNVAFYKLHYICFIYTQTLLSRAILALKYGKPSTNCNRNKNNSFWFLNVPGCT